MQQRNKRLLHVLAAGILVCLPVLSAEAAPKRIVSLAPSCAEIVAGLGLATSIVGVTSFTDYPPEAATLPTIGSYVDPNLEAILSLQPDLIVATSDGNPARILQRLRELGPQLVVLDLQTYESIQKSILELGSITGRGNEAHKLTTLMKETAECIRARTLKAPLPSVLFVYDSYPFVTPGRGTFTDQLIEMAAGKSITRDVSMQYPRLTIESVIARNPEVVIESSMDPELEKNARLEWWKQYPMIPAVKQNRVLILESRNLDRPSHLIVRGFLKLAAALHPDLFSNGECSGNLP